MPKLLSGVAPRSLDALLEQIGDHSLDLAGLWGGGGQAAEAAIAGAIRARQRSGEKDGRSTVPTRLLSWEGGEGEGEGEAREHRMRGVHYFQRPRARGGPAA